jgi:hypothetical protein
LQKSFSEYKRKLESSCAEMGIAGIHFRDELQRLPAQLPSLFAQVASCICSEDIEDALVYHAALQSYLRDCEGPADPAEGKPGKKKTAEHQDVALFAFFKSIRELQEASEEAEAPPVALDFEVEAADIEWDISMSTGDADLAIDWGIETMASDEVTSDDSGIQVEAAEIDWDISTEPADVSTSSFSIGGDAVVVDVNETVRATTRVGLLSDNEFRSHVLNDLLELKMFLRQRRVEVADQTTTTVAFANQFHGSSCT